MYSRILIMYSRILIPSPQSPNAIKLRKSLAT